MKNSVLLSCVIGLLNNFVPSGQRSFTWTYVMAKTLIIQWPRFIFVQTSVYLWRAAIWLTLPNLNDHVKFEMNNIKTFMLLFFHFLGIPTGLGPFIPSVFQHMMGESSTRITSKFMVKWGHLLALLKPNEPELWHGTWKSVFQTCFLGAS